MRRQRRVVQAMVLLLIGGALLICSGLLSNANPLARRLVTQSFGDYIEDDALDKDPTLVDGFVVSHDVYDGRPIISVEYFHGREIFVTYQRIERELYDRIQMGDPIVVEIVDAEPDVARVEGTRLAARAEVTRNFDRWMHAWGFLRWFAYALIGALWLKGFTLARSLNTIEDEPSRADPSDPW